MKQKYLNIYHAKGENQGEGENTYVMYIVKLNNTSEVCDTSQANDPVGYQQNRVPHFYHKTTHQDKYYSP
jgi:hypothetical protein